ncbi:MAG: C25 family cysteine peptidase [Candidatus Cloacimonadales bacterium]|nr:C25 family cysteine peptidase [Candidatus Cloacimonadales bacterium]
MLRKIMKSVATISFSIFIVNLLYAEGNWVSFTRSTPDEPIVNLNNSTNQNVSFEVEFFGINSEEVVESGTTYQRISIPECFALDETGKPEVPIVRQLIAIPESDSVNFSINIINEMFFDDYNIYPAPDYEEVYNADGTAYLAEVFAKDDTVYNTNQFFPQVTSEIREIGYIRDQKVAEVYIYPIQFNPVTHQIKANTNYEIELSFINQTSDVNVNTGIFNNVCANTILNYQSSGITASINTGADPTGNVEWIIVDNTLGLITADYLIITADQFFDIGNHNPYIDLLANHRAEYNGFDVAVVNVEDVMNVYEPDDPFCPYVNEQKIRNFIKKVYEEGTANHTFDGHLAYVLLVGDTELNGPEPMPAAYERFNKPFDYYYTCVTEVGNEYDSEGDLYIGRFSAGDTTELQNYVIKTINHELEENAENWRNRIILTTAPIDEFNPYAPYIEPCTEISQIIPSEYEVIQVIAGDGYLSNDDAAALLVAEINSGVSIASYWDHGYSTRWTTFHESDFDLLNNEYMQPYVISMACWTGDFDNTFGYGDCMAEFFTNTSDKGAVGFVGNPRTTCNLATGKFINKAIWEDFCYIAGENVLEAKLQNVSEERRYEYNYFGDPALNIMITEEEWGLPDLAIKKSDITIPEGVHNIGDIIPITIRITNNTPDTTAQFDVSFYLGNPEDSESELIETVIVDTGIGSYSYEELSIEFNTANHHPDYYELYIWVDSGEDIEERFKSNNINYTPLTLYQFKEGFPVSLCTVTNSNPISFDISDEYPGEEIICGENFLTCNGNIISEFPEENNTSGYTSIGNLYNDGEFQYLETALSESYENKLECFNSGGSLEWDFSYPVGEVCSQFGPIIGDIDNDGNEEILFCCSTGAHDLTYFLYCINSDGSQRWCTDFNEEEIFLPIVANIQGYDEKMIILPTIDRVCLLNNNGVIVTTLYSASGNDDIYPPCISSDLDKDGYLDIIFLKKSENDYYLGKLENGIYQEIFLGEYIHDGTSEELREAIHNISEFAISDMNNDGLSEIISSFCGSVKGIHIINNEMSSDFIDIPTLSKKNIVIGDLDNDNSTDIVCMTRNGIKEYIEVYDNSCNKQDSVPFIGQCNSLWLSNIDQEPSLELVYNVGYDLYVIDFPSSGTSVEWKGFQCNYRNSGVYEQPAYYAPQGDTVYWTNTISLSNTFEIPENSTVIIKQGAIIKAHSNSKLIVSGELIAQGTEIHSIKFIPDIQGASQDYWQGLEFPEGNSVAELYNVIIENACVNAERELTINGGSFINTPLLQDRQSLWLTDVDFDYSPITAELYGITQLEIVSINNCHIFNSPMNSGVEITGYPNLDISNNTIGNCLSGIKIWESGPGAINTIANNHISNNTEYGLFIFHSNIDIEGNNVISDNEEGLFVTHNSNFSMVGSENYPLQIVRENNTYEVRFTYDSRPSQFYHNKIYDDNHEYSYVKCEHVPLIYMPISVSNNNWGASFNPETDLSPLEVFTYLPIWYPGNPGNPEKGIDEEMYLSAKLSEESGNYQGAEQTYEQIITLYPESEYAKIAAKELLALKVKYDQDFFGLKFYFETEPNMQYDDEMIRLSEFLITCCNVKLEEFEPAITWFEGIIQNPPSPVDSVFAVIDAGYTYLVMDNSRSCFSGEISELKPQSRKQYTIKRDELIDMLFGDTEPENEIPTVYELKLFPNYPNPFNPETTISFSIPEDSKVGLTIYNIKGQKVRTLVNGELEKGLHDVVWNSKDSSSKSVASGVYFYKFDVNGKMKGLKKMLLLK